MLPQDLTKDIINRLSSIKGRFDGIGKMLKDGQGPDQILIQLKAVQKGLDRANYLLLDEVYRKALAIKIVKTVEACPGDCGSEHKIEDMRRQFPSIRLDEIAGKMREI